MNKNIYNKVKGLAKAVLPLSLFALLPLAVACSPDSFDGADETKIPTVAGEDFNLEVDQEVNQIIVSYPQKQGTYPIWIFNGAAYSTLNTAGWQNNKAGTYTVEMKLGNRNGFSQGSIKKTFTFNETKASFTTQLNRIKDKQWRIDSAEPAHLACGPWGGDGTGWWNASPDEKKDFGVYDDRITFKADNTTGGSFTYDPGADGKTYINIGCSLWDNGGATADFDLANVLQNSTFEFKKGNWTDAEGVVNEVDYIELAPKTFFPYISSDDQYNNPRFRVETLTASKMVLIYEKPDQSIAWRFIFTSKEGEKKFEGFNANSDFNMWKGITPVMSFYYNPDPGWGNEQTPVLEAAFQGGDNDYNITVPGECYADWQAQVHFHTNLSINDATHYDFSCILSSDRDINGVIIKLTDETDSDFIIEEHVDLKAGEEYIVWKSDVPGKNLQQVKLATDYGHATGETHINLRNVVLKDHANDDGTVLPGGDTPAEPSVTWVAVDSPDNLGRDFNTIGQMQFWWADGGWQQIGDPQFSFAGGVYTIVATENGGSEWQAQCSIHNANVGIEAGQLYDVRAKIEASADLGRMTFKICDEGDDDNTLIYNGAVTLQAGENYVEFIGVKAQKSGEDSGFQTAKLFLDLGGAPVGFELQLSDIIIQKHDESGSGNADAALSYDSSDNLWKAVDEGSAFVSVTPWFADGGWQQIGDPEWEHSGRTWSLTLPEGMGSSQWQGQFPINTTISTKQTDKYSFQCTVTASNDCEGITIKLTESDDADGTKHDSNFYFAERHDVKAGEPYTYTVRGATLPLNDAHALSLFFDFGGSPVGTFIEISDITLIKE